MQYSHYSDRTVNVFPFFLPNRSPFLLQYPVGLWARAPAAASARCSIPTQKVFDYLMS